MEIIGSNNLEKTYKFKSCELDFPQIRIANKNGTF